MQGIVKSVLCLKLVFNKGKEGQGRVWRLELEHWAGSTEFSSSNLISYIVKSCSRTGAGVQLVELYKTISKLSKLITNLKIKMSQLFDLFLIFQTTKLNLWPLQPLQPVTWAPNSVIWTPWPFMWKCTLTFYLKKS